jgi:hypothetical protein
MPCRIRCPLFLAAIRGLALDAVNAGRPLLTQSGLCAQTGYESRDNKT